MVNKFDFVDVVFAIIVAIMFLGIVSVMVTSHKPVVPLAQNLPKVEAKLSLSGGALTVSNAFGSSPCDLHMAVSTPVWGAIQEKTILPSNGSHHKRSFP